MILYHGSTEIVEYPEIRVNNNGLDFGVGFYTTSSFEQAKKWAIIKAKRNNAFFGYVSSYYIDIDKIHKESDVKIFDGATVEWLNFVVKNRQGMNDCCFSDLYIGPVADDNIYQTVKLFETGAYDAEYTIKKLKTEVLQDQWAFHTDKALSYLKFCDSERVDINDR